MPTNTNLFLLCVFRSLFVLMVAFATATPSFAVMYWQSDFDVVENAPMNEPTDLPNPGRDLTVLIQLPQVGSVFVPYGSGVVIAPNWIITAKHVLDVAFNDPSDDPDLITLTIDEEEYKAAQIYRYPNSEFDIGLVRIKKANGDDANLENWIPLTNEFSAGSAVTIGGYGQQRFVSDDDIEISDSQGNQALRWGRNIAFFDSANTSLSVALDHPTTPAYLKYEALMQPGDSGGGTFVRDGWEWRLAGINASTETRLVEPGPLTGRGIAWSSNVTMETPLDWIETTMGADFEAPETSAAILAADTEWIGATSVGWSSPASWSSGVVPTISDNVWVNDSPSVSGSACAKNLFVGVDGDNEEDTGGDVTLTTGALLTVSDTISLGAEHGDGGSLTQNAGDISSTREFVGYRGTGVHVQKSGANSVRETVYVGYAGGSVASPSRYTMSASGPGNGILESASLVVGALPGSFGEFRISTGGTQVVKTGVAILGAYGAGNFIQNGGTTDVARLLVIGDQSTGSGQYTLNNNGVLTTGSTIVGKFGAAAFIQNGGIHSTGRLVVSSSLGSYDLNGGLLELTDHESEVSASSGLIDFLGSTARLKISGDNGIINLTMLKPQNNENAYLELSVANDALVLLGGSSFSPGNVTVGPNRLQPHTTGSDLTINQYGFRGGNGAIADYVRLGGTGHIDVSSSTADDSFTLRALILGKALQLAGAGSIHIEAGGRLLTSTNPIVVSGGTPTIDVESDSTGNPLGSLVITLPSSQPIGIDIQDGAHLTANGRIEIKEGVGKIVVRDGGVLEVGSTVSRMDVLGNLTIEPDGQLLMDVSDIAADQLRLEGVESGNSLILNGTLVLDIPSASVPDKFRLHVLATTFGYDLTPAATFGKVASMIDGSPLDGIIASNTTSEPSPFDVALAVLYPEDFATFGISLSEAECPNNSCIVVRSTLPGDLNGDNAVDFDDYLKLQNNYNGPGTYTNGDLNGNGLVNFDDYLIMQNYYGQSWGIGGGGGVPEPSSAILFVCAALGLLIGSPRRVR